MDYVSHQVHRTPMKREAENDYIWLHPDITWSILVTGKGPFDQAAFQGSKV